MWYCPECPDFFIFQNSLLHHFQVKHSLPITGSSGAPSAEFPAESLFQPTPEQNQYSFSGGDNFNSAETFCGSVPDAAKDGPKFDISVNVQVSVLKTFFFLRLCLFGRVGSFLEYIFNLNQYKGSNRKQSARWQHVSRLKASAFCIW